MFEGTFQRASAVELRFERQSWIDFYVSRLFESKFENFNKFKKLIYLGNNTKNTLILD